MAATVIMPKVDMDQETGTISEWLKQEGERVEKGEPILIIETNKVAIEIEAPASGILQGIQAEQGEVVPIGTIIAYILEPGEELPAPPAIATSAPDVAATPVARNVAAIHGIDLAKIAGTGPRGKVTKKDVQTVLDVKSGVKVCATPAARRTARERGIDLATVTGSGPRGRVQAADVLALALTPSAPLRPGTGPSPEIGRGENVIPLQGMRRTIAERMTASYQTAPHITFTVRVDMSGFEEARARLNARAEAAGQPRVSATALIVKAVAWALKRHRLLNSTLQDDGIHLLPEINVGVAVAIPPSFPPNGGDEGGGLIVPVIRQADQKSLGEIAAEVNDLATRAREGRMTPSDVAGGTFTVSNLGPFGIEQFTAIINPPQAAILAVGTSRPEVVVGEEGQIVVRPVMRMTLSADHRVVDGAVAARFLSDLREALEAPVLLL